MSVHTTRQHAASAMVAASDGGRGSMGGKLTRLLTARPESGCAHGVSSHDNRRAIFRTRRVAGSTCSRESKFTMKATYVSLLTYTDQGIRALAQSPKRAIAFRHNVEAAGVKVLAQLWTAGEYDGVLVLQADREEQVLRVLAQLAAAGNVRPHSLRAFDADDFAILVGS
jgi:uncharacterized protein with GYD domain